MAGYRNVMSSILTSIVMGWEGQEDYPTNIPGPNSPKNIQDRVNSIVLFALYANKKTGSCRG